MIVVEISVDEIIERSIVINLDSFIFIDEFIGVLEKFSSIEELEKILLSYGCISECSKIHSTPVIHTSRAVFV